jgi:hypothetical protein
VKNKTIKISEATKLPSTVNNKKNIKDNKKGYLVIDNNTGMPFSTFATDEARTPEEALQVFYRNARAYGISQQLLNRLDLDVKEVPFEDAIKMGMLMANKGDGTVASFMELGDKLQADQQAEWSDGAIDADYEEVVEPKLLSQIDEVLSLAGCLTESVEDDSDLINVCDIPAEVVDKANKMYGNDRLDRINFLFGYLKGNYENLKIKYEMAIEKIKELEK